MDRPSTAPASILKGRLPSGQAEQDHAQTLQHLHKSDLPLKSEAAQRTFFECSLERALEAEAKAGLVERWFQVAGATLCVRFAGEGLIESLTPALAHLAIPAAAKADGVFHVFDSESTGIQMVPPICSRDHLTGRGDIWSLQSRRFRSAFLGAETAVALMDVETSTAVFWIQSAGGLPYWAKASPMRNLLHWWMERRGCQLVHGAAVGFGGEGVLITGQGGLGKSTTALACLDAGLQYLADDFLVVEPGDPARAHSLYSTGKLDWVQMKRFSRFAALARNHGSPLGDKAVLYLHPAFEDRLVRSLNLKAILMPRILARPESGLASISRSVLERAASFSTITLLPHSSANTMAFIGRLVANLPGLALELGSEIAAIPATVERLLRRPPAEITTLSRAAPVDPPNVLPLVSVIVPVRNGASFLPEAMASIEAQNYPALETIVVDDGSTDDIDDVLARLPRPIKYVRQEPSGPAAARNRGIREAKGELIAFLDVDDLWPRDNLGTLIDAILGDGTPDVVQGYAQIMRLMPDSGAYEFIGSPLEVFQDYLGSALYRRSAFDKVGLLDESLIQCEDVEWFYRARDGGLVIKRLQQISLFVRRHAENMTKTGSQREYSLQALKKIIAHKRRRVARSLMEAGAAKRSGP